MQGVERLGELGLRRARFPRNELHVVDHQRVDATEATAELLHAVALERDDHLVDERLARDVADGTPGREQRICDGRQEMCLAGTDSAMDEERVEPDVGPGGHRFGGR